MMKNVTAMLVIASITATSTAVFAGSAPKSGINGSPHDLNSFGSVYVHDKWERTCVFCHTPHNAQKTGDLANTPLWNHELTTLPVMAPYKWVSPANAATGANNNAMIAFAADPLIGPSRLCMACHDGTTAPDSHGTAGTSTDTVQGTSGMKARTTATYQDAYGTDTYRYITDLTVTHPIGFLYQDALDTRGTKELVLPSEAFIADDVLPLGSPDFNTQTRAGLAAPADGKRIKDTLYNGYMTCASCHDVHNSVNASPRSGNTYNYFLYAQEEGSAICLSCHKK